MLTWSPFLWAWPSAGVHITVGDFRRLLPLFAQNYTDEEIAPYIEMLKCFFNPCVWGCWLPWAEAYWVAHMLLLNGTATIPPLTPPSGQITAKHVGDTSISYAAPSQITAAQQQNSFNWTPWGKLYLALQGQLPQTIGLMIV